MKRYNIEHIGCIGRDITDGWDDVGEMVERENGEWVKYSDHLAELAKEREIGKNYSGMLNNAVGREINLNFDLAKKDAEIARLRKALEEIDCECHRFEPISTIPEIENIHDLVIEALAPEKEKEKKGKCICAELLNSELNAVPNPDCPVHGAGFSWGKE